ncbi:MAG: DUF389 domain-containing protein [Rivularia sp. (in: Bacteria)]|nr:DUF389 domain-containing protein [Rivularia sp. MS3]
MLLFVKNFSRWGKLKLTELWNSNSGDWHWLAEKPMPIAGINRKLWRGAVPSLSFYTLLALSAVISTFGLLANSAATIIGAMIIAPLMGPIIAIAYSIVSGNQRLLKRSSFTLFKGVLLTVIISIVITKLVGIRTFGSEIMGRTSPTLLDLGVALAAGAAGGFALTRRSIANALPGVAISVALVPPLSVVGIGLGMNSNSVAAGSGLLFLANLAGIIFSGSLVFLAHNYGSFEKARHGLVISIFSLIMLGLPLGLSLEKFLVKEHTRRSIEYLLFRQTDTFTSSNIRRVEVEQDGEKLLVYMEITAPLNYFSQKQIQLVQQILEDDLNKPLTLKVKVIPTQEYTAD